MKDKDFFNNLDDEIHSGDSQEAILGKRKRISEEIEDYFKFASWIHPSQVKDILSIVNNKKQKK